MLKSLLNDAPSLRTEVTSLLLTLLFVTAQVPSPYIVFVHIMHAYVYISILFLF